MRARRDGETRCARLQEMVRREAGAESSVGRQNSMGRHAIIIGRLVEAVKTGWGDRLTGKYRRGNQV